MERTTIYDDAILRRLELRYRGAVVKVFCPTRGSGGSEGWSGFVVNARPCIIVSVSHPVRRLTRIVDVLHLFHVNFFGDNNNYQAVALGCKFGCDMLVLYCKDVPPGPPPPFFAFADPSVPLVSSTSFFSISHPDGRGWSTLRGTICREPFEIGPHPYYHSGMIVFDHTASLYPGASGAPLINVNGEVIGMQVTQISKKLNGLCLKGRSQDVRAYDLINQDNFNRLQWEVKEMSFLRCDIRQAITVQYMLEGLREIFPSEVSDPYTTDLNHYLRYSIDRHLRRRASQGSSLGQGIQPKEKPRDSASRKRPREKSMMSGKGRASPDENCNPKILHQHVEVADILLDYFSKAKAVDPKSTHLCKDDSAKPLVSSSDTKKRCGRTDELIQILQAKLKQIEEGSAFGGKRVKAGRSQGKKKDITVEQEYARLLGNLAWAYLQQGKYKSAEEMYRKSLSFELDRNKQCNLAVCLMHMNRMKEAKLLLQTVRDSCDNGEMDESYAKAYDRAMESLTQLESRQGEKLTASAEERYVNIPAPFSPFNCRGPERCFTQNGGPKRRFVQLSDANRVNSPGHNNWFQSPPQYSYGDKWKKATFGSQSNDKWGSKDTTKKSFMFNKEDVASPVPNEAASEVLLTQPRRCTWSFGNEEKKKEVVHDVHRKLIFGQVNAVKCTVETSKAANCIEAMEAPSDGDDGVKKLKSDTTDSVKSTEAVEKITTDSEVNHDIQSQSKSPRGTEYEDFFTWTGKKSWADIAEEEEQDSC